MVNLLTGPKGSGKTQKMIELANDAVNCYNGNVVFIKKSHRDTYSLSFNVRVVCMDDYEAITNIDEYIGFIYGMVSANRDIEAVFIDGILKHADVTLDNMPTFIDRLKKVSSLCNIEFFVSISASIDDLKDIDMVDCKVLN